MNDDYRLMIITSVLGLALFCVGVSQSYAKNKK